MNDEFPPGEAAGIIFVFFPVEPDFFSWGTLHEVHQLKYTQDAP